MVSLRRSLGTPATKRRPRIWTRRPATNAGGGNSWRRTEKSGSVLRLLSEYRGHGHAATVVTAWAHAVTARGALPMYSTSSDNVASQRVAAKCGFTAYGSDYHIT
jgi:hypothetical protein